jgi:cell division protease FtsH
MKWSRILYLVLLVMIAAFLYAMFFNQTETSDTVHITRVAELAQNGQIQKVTVLEDTLEIVLNDGTTLISRKEPGLGALETLERLGVSKDNLGRIKVEVAAPSWWGGWLTILSALLPLILIGGFFFFIFRQAQGAGNQALSFGKSRARMFTGDKPTITFDDVAGADEAKEELAEVVEFLVSGEAGVPFFSISGSEFVEMFVGVGASRVRDLFDQAKRNSPCIVFVDEIDAVGRHRGAGLGGSHDEREQTLNQILVEMDGFDTDTNVIVVAATNRPDILDPALLRPGRFDRRVVLDRPDWIGREKILEVHVRGKPIGSNVNLEIIARQTPGFVGADLENLVNEAAILAARRNKKVIEMTEFEESIEKIIAGPERKSRVISEEEKRIIAHHEAGHALVMKMLPDCDPVHKVSIVARGMTGGYTMTIPEEDRYLQYRNKFKADLASLLGGRAAEEIIFREITTGASNDLDRATKLARAMVTKYGMSESLGPLTFGQKEELIFLGRELSDQRNYSEEIARQIDREVRRLIEEAYQTAKRILIANRDKLSEIAERLVAEETIDAPSFHAMFA